MVKEEIMESFWWTPLYDISTKAAVNDSCETFNLTKETEQTDRRRLSRSSSVVLKILKRDGKGGFDFEVGMVLDGGGVFRVGRNVTGSVLASRQLWKSDFGGNWRCISEVHGDATCDAEEDMTMSGISR
mmetsp:Transcript_20772/g.25744  ORF Transcript_20772/g.25744 Transcript_20772/m.25744 type:complete len:129 (+) Transcript_20772:143-529(+)